ncbi:hypothetical protein [Trueperella bernardiae]|uniref:hypothetical protein n=1 Tax=Trueperella bernardiae TaxID=59561 RepID=UPI002044013E|nr:hypothetical protein [Trueperella bernardiae]MCM3907605.1 hypothetical protein [Trueperella bernardiae]
MSVKVKLNHDQFAAYLKSGPVAGLVGLHARQVAGRAGPGYEASTWAGDSRVIGSVITATPKAIRSNAKNNTLLRALVGGGS